MFGWRPFAWAHWRPHPVSSMSMSFHPKGTPVLAAGMAAEERMTDLVLSQLPV